MIFHCDCVLKDKSSVSRKSTNTAVCVGQTGKDGGGEGRVSSTLSAMYTLVFELIRVCARAAGTYGTHLSYLEPGKRRGYHLQYTLLSRFEGTWASSRNQSTKTDAVPARRPWIRIFLIREREIAHWASSVLVVTPCRPISPLLGSD